MYTVWLQEHEKWTEHLRIKEVENKIHFHAAAEGQGDETWRDYS